MSYVRNDHPNVSFTHHTSLRKAETIIYELYIINIYYTCPDQYRQHRNVYVTTKNRLFQSLRKGPRRTKSKAGAAEVKPYGGQEKKRKLRL